MRRECENAMWVCFERGGLAISEYVEGAKKLC